MNEKKSFLHAILNSVRNIYDKFWGWEFIQKLKSDFPRIPFIFNTLRILVYTADTFILMLIVLSRRILKVGLSKLTHTPKIPNDILIYYFDLGLHIQAQELILMVRDVLPSLADEYKAFGFEASKEFFTAASGIFEGYDNVQLINKALTYEVPANGKIKLFIEGEEGLGSSIYNDLSDSKNYEEVEAGRFSDWLNENKLDLEKNICLIRMNIEGAELDVITDLIASGYSKYFDGYYGSWDDVTRTKKMNGKDFHALLTKNNISHITFNGRDLKFPSRIKCIKYDINTSIISGLQRITRTTIKIPRAN